MKEYPKVLNTRWQKSTNKNGSVYIGRPSKYGNPFSHLENTKAAYKVATREEAVRKYEEWILNNPVLLEQAKIELKGKDLICWCRPAACHGDVLIKLVND